MVNFSRATKSPFSQLHSTSGPDFCDNTTTRKCVHTTKKRTTDFSSPESFFSPSSETLVRIPPKNFFFIPVQSKKLFFSLVIHQSAARRRLRMGKGWKCIWIKCFRLCAYRRRENCCFPHRSLHTLTVLWSWVLRVHPLQNRSRLPSYRDAVITPKAYMCSFLDMLLNIVWLCWLWKHCTMHR